MASVLESEDHPEDPGYQSERSEHHRERESADDGRRGGPQRGAAGAGGDGPAEPVDGQREQAQRHEEKRHEWPEVRDQPVVDDAGCRQQAAGHQRQHAAENAGDQEQEGDEKGVGVEHVGGSVASDITVGNPRWGLNCGLVPGRRLYRTANDVSFRLESSVMTYGSQYHAPETR